MNRLFITLPIFPRKIAVFQLSLNPSLKVSFTQLSSHGFPLVSPAVSHSKLNRTNLPDPTHTCNKIYRMAKPTRCMPNAIKIWVGVLGERKHQLIGEQSTIPVNPPSSTAGSDAWHCPCYCRPDWYPFNICMLISAQRPYIVYAS